MKWSQPQIKASGEKLFLHAHVSYRQYPNGRLVVADIYISLRLPGSGGENVAQ